MGRNTGGNRGDVRQSALWGSGNRGGEFRSNALWGRGGKGLVTTVLAFALAVPLAATAASGPSSTGSDAAQGSYVSDVLSKKAKSHPNELVSVIVQVDPSAAADTSKRAENEMRRLGKRFGLINGFAGEIRAKDLEKLARIPGLKVTEDAATRPLGTYTSTQLWTHESGVNKLWSGPQAPTIAIVDSGVDALRADFDLGARVVTQQTFVSTGNTNSPGDGRGHGTFVAGIAAGSAPGFAGAAPNAKIVSLDVFDDSGSGKTSDVIAAAEWIYQNHKTYGIRVANFSLHSGYVGHFWNDPLNVAVEKLWFAGIVVVAAAGNYGKADGPSNVPYAPGSDPFVITVGALDIGGTHKLGDDARAPWSAYGRTYDGFWKPEICASGRYMVGPIPATSTLAQLKSDKLVGNGYIELSGTSFAAPVVSGLAAQILARYPSFTPDDVKGAIMRRVRAVPNAAPLSCGAGQVNAVRSGAYASAATPNKALWNYVKQDSATGQYVFDAVSWADASKSDVSWDNVSWADVSWADVSWDSVSWSDVSWADVSWSDVSWSDVSWEDSTSDTTVEGDGYELTTPEADAAAQDAELLTPEEQEALLSSTSLLSP